MKKVVVGIIGFGKSANRYHLPYLLKNNKIVVKKIFSRTVKEDLEKSMEEYNIEFVRNVDELLNDKEIDLITICTGLDSHYSFAKLALEHGKNVLVEKPFVTSLDEAKELFSISKEKNLIIMPYQNRRFDSDFLGVKEVILSGKLGEIVEIESHFDYYRPEVSSIEGTPYDGAFYGLGVHTIDQIVSLFGKPDKVYYDIRSIRKIENPDDYYHVELFYGNLKVILKTSHLVKIPYPKFIIHGTKGSFVKYGIDRQEDDLKAGKMPWEEGFGLDSEENYGKLQYVDKNGDEIQEVLKTPKGDYGMIYEGLYNSIIKGESPIIDEMEALTVIEILQNGISKL